MSSKPLKTAGALRAGDTEFLNSPIMDEQDKIDFCKLQMRARSRATLHLKRASAALLRRVDKTYEDSYMQEEREALRKALLNIPFCDAPSIPLTDPPNAELSDSRPDNQ